RRVLVPAGHRGRTDGAHAGTGDEPRLVATLFVPPHVGNEIAPLLRHPGRPQVRRFDDMGVGIDDLDIAKVVHENSSLWRSGSGNSGAHVRWKGGDVRSQPGKIL